MAKNEIIKLGIDVAQGRLPLQYSVNDADTALRVGFNQMMGLADDATQIPYKTFRKHKVEIFEILEEVFDSVLEEGLRGQLDDFVEYRNLALGDMNEFVVPANKAFRVSVVSDGNGNFRRQRLIDGTKFSVDTDIYGVKIYEEFSRFMAGRIDWLGMVRDVATSMAKDIEEKIASAIMNHFTEAGAEAPYRLTSSGAVPTEKEIITMAKHVEAATGEKAVIYGSALALNQLDLRLTSEADKEARNTTGYYGKVGGVEVREIVNGHKIGGTDFIFADDFLLILPQTKDRMCKVVNEGTATIEETVTGNADMTKEYMMINKVGISIIASKVFGYIKFATI